MEKERVAELVKLVLEGDKKAFEALYAETNQNAYFVALKITKNEQDALDILQESYIKSLENLSQLKEPENFVAWFKKIVANTAKNYIIKRRTALFKTDESEQMFTEQLTEDDGEFIPEKSFDTKETRAMVTNIIDSLPEDRRLCVLMYYFDEMSVFEIAETLSVSVGTVKSHLYYSRKTIREKVESMSAKGVTVLGAASVPFFAWLLKKGTIAARLSESSAAAVLSTVEGASALLCGAVATGAAGAGAAAGGSASAGAVSGTAAKIIAGITVPKIIAAGTAAAVMISGVAAGTSLIRQNAETKAELSSDFAAVEAMATTESGAFGYGTEIYEETESFGDSPSGIEMSEKISDIEKNGTEKAPGATEKPSQSAAKSLTNRASVPASNEKPQTVTISPTAAATKPVTTATKPTTTTTKPTTTTTKPTTTATKPTITTTKPTTTATKPTTTTAKPTTTTTTKPTTTKTTSAIENTYTASDGNVTITGYTGSGGVVTIPDKIDDKIVTAIAAYAYENKTSITIVKIPASVTSIGAGAFSGCTSLEKVELPSGLLNLGNLVFKNCTKLSGITIPPGVTSIGNGTFQGCSKLQSAYIPAGVTTIGINAFASCPDLTIYCVDGSAAHSYAVTYGINCVLS